MAFSNGTTAAAPMGGDPAAAAAAGRAGTSSFAGNALIQLAGQLAPMVVAFVCMPFVIRTFGTERIGLLSLILVIISYFTLLDLGLGRAVTKTVAEAISVGEAERIPGIFWTALLAQTAAATIGAALLVAASPVIVERLLNIPPQLRGEARASLMLAAASLPLAIAASSTIGLLQGVQRFDFAVLAQLPVSVANSLLPLVVGQFTHDLSFVMWALLVTRTASFAMLLLAAHRGFPELRRRRFERSELGPLLRYGGWIALTGLIAPILIYADRLVIGTMLTMSAVAYYTIPADLASRMLLVPASISTAIFPVLSRRPGAAHDDAGAVVAQSFKYVLCVVGIPAALLSAYSYDALALWLGADFADHAATNFRILLIGIAVNGLGYVLSTLVQARGRPDLTGRLQLIELPFYVVAIGLGGRTWGLAGIALAWTARVTVDALALFGIARKVGPLSTADLFRRNVGSGLGLVSLTWVGAMISTSLDRPALRLASGVAVATAASYVAWRHVLGASERSRITGALAKGWRGLSRRAT